MGVFSAVWVVQGGTIGSEWARGLRPVLRRCGGAAEVWRGCGGVACGDPQIRVFSAVWGVQRQSAPRRRSSVTRIAEMVRDRGAPGVGDPQLGVFSAVWAAQSGGWIRRGWILGAWIQGAWIQGKVQGFGPELRR
ncbi:hypothetical protein GCM10010910_16380 [Microbacterium nanhaiense]|uniref:Uncharacterized protein n=1 Tax=Microbacterium nanhaiense TaxID=1301026 RepID=A0ABQ2N2E2_9MICO|nr:hypothetical protein GCM10010910_16380 [Microbacterium nanhaiense]